MEMEMDVDMEPLAHRVGAPRERSSAKLLHNRRRDLRSVPLDSEHHRLIKLCLARLTIDTDDLMIDHRLEHHLRQ